MTTNIDHSLDSNRFAPLVDMVVVNNDHSSSTVPNHQWRGEYLKNTNLQALQSQDLERSYMYIGAVNSV